MIRNKNIQQGDLEADRFHPNLDRYVFERLLGYLPSVNGGLTTGAAAVGTTGAANVMRTNRASWTLHIKGAGQTLITPTPEDAGLEIGHDKTNAEGVEYMLGNLFTSNPYACTIKTDVGWFFRVKLKLADVSGNSDFMVGFRKNQAFQTARLSNTDYFGLGINVSAATAAVKQMTQVATGGETSTDTLKTWADGETHTIEVRISETGVVTFFFDSVEVTKVAFTATSGMVVMPVIWNLYSATLPDKINLVEYEAGPFSCKRVV